MIAIVDWEQLRFGFGFDLVRFDVGMGWLLLRQRGCACRGAERASFQSHAGGPAAASRQQSSRLPGTGSDVSLAFPPFLYPV